MARIPAEVWIGLGYVTVCVGWLELFHGVVEPGVRRALGHLLGVRVVWQREGSDAHERTTWSADGPASARASATIAIVAIVTWLAGGFAPSLGLLAVRVMFEVPSAKATTVFMLLSNVTGAIALQRLASRRQASSRPPT